MLVLLAGAGIGLLALGGCARVIVSPLAVPPYRSQTTASYDDTWKALIRALMMDNLPLRVVAKDSGVIASDDFVSPIGVYADCGRFGGATPLLALRRSSTDRATRKVWRRGSNRALAIASKASDSHLGAALQPSF